jgi:hypothetical protein
MMCIHWARSPSVKMAAFRHDCRASLVEDHPHPLQGRAGADDVVQDDDLLPLHHLDIFFIQYQGLRLTGCDGQRLGFERLAHVRLVRLAEHHIRFFVSTDSACASGMDLASAVTSTS